MLGRNHIISACSGWILASPYLISNQPDTLITVSLTALVALGSLLPDIDHPESLLGRRVKFISIPLHFLQGDKSLLPWSEDSHSRGVTHSIWVLVACWWLISSPFPAIVALSFGFVAHLIGDALTPAGIRLFWPLSYKLRSPITFSTGGFVEHLFTFTLALVALAHWRGVDVLLLIKETISP